MERARANLKMGASGEPVFGFAASSTLPFIAHGELVEQASVATIRKAAMQLRRPHPGVQKTMPFPLLEAGMLQQELLECEGAVRLWSRH